MSNCVLEVRHINKTFPGVKALSDVSIQIQPGQAHAFVGENGAGKSTLMKILNGNYTKDSGEILMDDKPVEIRSPQEAHALGISIIFQEFNLVPTLSVAENLFIGRLPKKKKRIDWKQLYAMAHKALDRIGYDLDPTMPVSKLTVAQMQMVEIAKAISYDNTRVLLMDEPSATLTNKECDMLFQVVRELKNQGIAVIYISHRLEEIFEICDSVSVFRNGTYVNTRSLDGVTRDELISMMVGRDVKSVFPKVDCEIGDVVFKVDKLCGKGFHDISFEVHAGEILGISGLVGSGRSETMRAIFGLDPLESGTMYLDGKEITNKSPRSAIKKGICMVNEDRKNYGLCLLRSIRENISLPNLPEKQKGLLINQNREKKECAEAASKLTVKAASIEHNGFSLSGGNQQKVVLAKWIMANPRVLILDEPTRGVDVGAKSDIHTLMCEFAAKGMAIIMISSELPEVMGMSDRILVYHEGTINGIVDRSEIMANNITQKELLEMAFAQNR